MLYDNTLVHHINYWEHHQGGEKERVVMVYQLEGTVIYTALVQYAYKSTPEMMNVYGISTGRVMKRKGCNNQVWWKE